MAAQIPPVASERSRCHGAESEDTQPGGRAEQSDGVAGAHRSGVPQRPLDAGGVNSCASHHGLRPAASLRGLVSPVFLLIMTKVVIDPAA